MTRIRATTVVALLMIPAVLAARQSFRSGIDMVRVDVLVTQNGRVVTGLVADDFDVLDNGVPQKLRLVPDVGGITVLPVLDTSASVAGDRLRDLLNATRALLGSLKPGDTAGLLTFRERVSVVVPLAPAGAETPDLAAALAQVGAAGSTELYDALFAGMTLAANDSGRSLLLLFTDGAETSSWLDRKAVEDAAKRLNVVVYAVVTGHDVDRAFLRRIADTTGGQVFDAESQELESRFSKVLEEFRQRVVLAFEPQGVRTDDGWHTLKVRLKSKQGTVKTRPGYFAGSR